MNLSASPCTTCNYTLFFLNEKEENSNNNTRRSNQSLTNKKTTLRGLWCAEGVFLYICSYFSAAYCSIVVYPNIHCKSSRYHCKVSPQTCFHSASNFRQALVYHLYNLRLEV